MLYKIKWEAKSNALDWPLTKVESKTRDFKIIKKVASKVLVEVIDGYMRWVKVPTHPVFSRLPKFEDARTDQRIQVIKLKSFSALI